MHESVSGQLFPPPIDAISVTAVWLGHEGWVVRVAHRHNGLAWDTCPHDEVADLSGSCVAEVVDASVCSLLAWPSGA